MCVCVCVCPHDFLSVCVTLSSFCVSSFLIGVCVCVCVCVGPCRVASSYNAALSCHPPSVECWRGRILGGDGQGSHGLVPLRLCGGSDATEPRQPIR